MAGNSATTTTTVTLPDPEPGDGEDDNSLAGNAAIVVDGILPTISSIAASGGSKILTLTMSEDVDGAPAAGDFAVLVNGSSNTVTDISDLSSATDTIELTLTSVVPNDAAVTVDYVQNATDANKIADDRDNYLATVDDPISATVTDDNENPTVSTITGVSGTYTATSDPNIDLLITMSEAVTVQGTPTLALSNGATASYLSSSSDNTALTFRYVVQSGDTYDNDLDFADTSSLTFGTDGMIKDLALNTADLSLADITNLADTYDIIAGEAP